MLVAAYGLSGALHGWYQTQRNRTDLKSTELQTFECLTQQCLFYSKA